MIGLVYNYGSIAYTDKLETNIEKRVQVPTTGRGKRERRGQTMKSAKRKEGEGREGGFSTFQQSLLLFPTPSAGFIGLLSLCLPLPTPPSSHEKAFSKLSTLPLLLLLPTTFLLGKEAVVVPSSTQRGGRGGRRRDGNYWLGREAFFGQPKRISSH